MNDTQSYTQSYYGQEPNEIILQDLMLSVLLHWKKILLVALIVALLSSIYVGTKEFIALSDESAAEARLEEYNTRMDDYERTSAQLQKSIEDTESELARQEEYRDSAMILQIDPYDVHVEKFSYYVDTNYEIAPSQYYQNPDYTSIIANAYVSEIEEIDFDSVLSAASNGTKYTTYNPVSGSGLKLVNVSTKGSGIIEVTIYGDDDRQIDIFKDAIIATLDSKYEEFSRLIGTHTLEVLSETRKVSVNKDFVSLRDTFNSNFETLNAKLDTSKKSLEELEVPENVILDTKDVLKRAIKYFIMGGLLGLFAMCFLVAVYLVGTNKLMNPQEITRRYSLPVLGVINTSEVKGRINNFAAKALGIPADSSKDEAAEYIASSLKLHAKDNPHSKILLVGTAEQDTMEELKERISPLLGGVEVAVAGNTNKSHDAVGKLTDDAAVVYVEKWQKSKLSDIESEMRIIQAAGKSAVGVVVV